MKERKGKIARFPPSLQTPAGAIWCWLRPSNRRWRWISGMLVESVKQVGWTMANCMNRRRQVDKCHSRIKMGAIWPQILHIIAKRNKAKQKSQTKSSGNSTTVLSPRLPSACHLAVAARRYHRQLTSIVFFNPIPAGIWISLPPPLPSYPPSAIGNPPSGIGNLDWWSCSLDPLTEPLAMLQRRTGPSIPNSTGQRPSFGYNFFWFQSKEKMALNPSIFSLDSK